jgi:hypothetical protein
MSINRPGFKPSLQANLEATKIERIWIKIPAGQSLLFRFLPPWEDGGAIWFPTANHYNLQDEEGNNVAPVDLSVHGTDETGTKDYINELVAVVKQISKKGKADHTVCFGKKSISTGWRYNAQVLVAEKKDGGYNYIGPKLWAAAPTAANAINAIDRAQKEMEEPLLADPDHGFNVLVTAHPAQPWYTAQRAGAPESLDNIYPEWADKFFTDVPEKVAIRLYTYEQQREAVRRTYPDQFDWDMLEEKYGL